VETSWEGEPPEIRCVVATLGAGGAERVCTRLCNNWARSDRRVEIILLTTSSAFLLPEVDPRVRVVSLATHRARRSVAGLARHLRRGPDVPVLVFGLHLAATVAAASILHGRRLHLGYREGSLPRTNVPRFWWWLYRYVIDRYGVVVAQSHAALAEMVSLGVRRPRRHVIPNPVPDGYWCHPAVAQARQQFRADLLGVGRLSPEKGFDRLIEAFAAWRAEWPSARLTILGDGPDRRRLAAKAEALDIGASFELPGFVRDTRPWLAGTPLVVSSSHYEGLPNALLEALASGCRIVASDSGGGTRELLRECGLSDFIVGDRSFSEAFCGVARHALKSPEHRWEAARERLRELASEDVVARAYWQACCARPAGRETS
jgi:glycosyltransferase involved in cell wall biosynthesis